MAYDEALADRIRDELADLAPQATEKKMFGGLAFLIAGNMAAAASGQGGILLRCDPAETDALLADPAGDGVAERMVMRGREMDGWLRVDDTALDDAEFSRWIGVGVDYASSLPPKRI